ncbi:MAG: arsenic resistance N-acetyltransferase ArsN2 [Balneolaceae bacterium]
MKTNASIVNAAQSDLNEIEDILRRNNLPIKDFSESEIVFYIVKDENEIIACAGIEKFENIALLRSVVIKEELRGAGLGSQFIDQILFKVKESNFIELYLLTENAEGFFSKKRFTSINREKAPECIKTSSEFSSICPSTAILMRNIL